VLNPFRLTGLSLPPRILLLCRLLALALLLLDEQGKMLTPIARVAIVLGCLLVLFTRYARVGAGIAGVTLLAGALIYGEPQYGGEQYAAILLLTAALVPPGAVVNTVRWLLPLLYFLDARSQPVFIAVPQILLGILMLFPSLDAVVIWTAGVLQCAVVLWNGDLTHLRFFALQAPLFAFVSWPQEPIIVIWDGSCGFCSRTKQWIERIDPDPMFRWMAQQTGIGDQFGLTRAQLREAMFAAGDKWVLRGYFAWKRMMLHLAIFWSSAVIGIALAPGAAGKRIAVALLLAFLTPLMNPLGVAAYGWVARHRHELLPGETCELP
jgi:predicted DCC family thiol-disulfide oxidoreductase YuxK